MKEKKSDTRLLLDNIRSVHNVGSIFRTADTLGMSKIYCIGTTPTPTDRFGRQREDFSKVSLGAEDSVASEYFDKSDKLVQELKGAGFKVIALEQSSKSVDYKEVNISDGFQSKTLIILGNEVDGVSKDLLEISDVIAEIPMRGEKESLNVSVAAAVFLYRLLDR
jgi:23S rRNA (guanosine2251-2'-O)-methyltransferase